MNQRLVIYSLLSFALLGITAFFYWPAIQEIREIENQEKTAAAMADQQESMLQANLKMQEAWKASMAAQAKTLNNKDLLSRIKTQSPLENFGSSNKIVKSPEELLASLVDSRNLHPVLKLPGTEKSETSIEFYQVRDRNNLYYVKALPSGDSLYFEMTDDSMKLEKSGSPLETWIDFFSALKIGKLFKNKSFDEKISGKESVKGQLVSINEVIFTIVGVASSSESQTLLKKLPTFNFYRDDQGKAYIGLAQGPRLLIVPDKPSVYSQRLAPEGCLPVYQETTEKSEKACRPLSEKEFPFTQLCEGADTGLLQLHSAISADFECYKESYLSGVDTCETDQDCHLVKSGNLSLFANEKSKSKAERFLRDAFYRGSYLLPLQPQGPPKCSEGRCSGVFYPEGYQQ